MGVYAETEKQESWYIIISKAGPKPLKTEIYLLNRKLAVLPPEKKRKKNLFSYNDM